MINAELYLKSVMGKNLLRLSTVQLEASGTYVTDVSQYIDNGSLKLIITILSSYYLLQDINL